MKLSYKIPTLLLITVLIAACSSNEISYQYPSPYRNTSNVPIENQDNDQIIVHTYDEAKQQSFDESSTQQHLPEAAQVGHVALLLPMSGSLGETAKAVRDGFFAAYYANSQTAKPVINVYDTQSDNQVAQAYSKAVVEGALFVVGPLTKTGLDQLKKLSSLPAPVLALNYNDVRDNRFSSEVYQFGLAPEDEVRQAVIQAKQDGRSSALILAPNSDWGRRLSSAFSQQWSSQGGRVVETAYFNENQDLSAPIKRALRVNDHESVQQPRPRGDIDMIFLVASTTQARQIKPLFAFYYAGDLPVYATSSVYTGISNPANDDDLNGITFCDAPWVLDSTSRQQTLEDNIRKISTSYSNTYTRFYALGIDAYDIINYLPALKNQPSYPFQGVTGNLTLSPDLRIVRQLPCAQFNHGQARLVSRPQIF